MPYFGASYSVAFVESLSSPERGYGVVRYNLKIKVGIYGEIVL